MCLVKIELKDFQSDGTEECMNNLIECVRMFCVLKETFVQVTIIRNHYAYILDFIIVSIQPK